MALEELIDRRAQLQRELQDATERFTRETGVNIAEIDIRSAMDYLNGDRQFLFEVKLDL